MTDVLVVEPTVTHEPVIPVETAIDTLARTAGVDYASLLTMLTYKRPAFCKTERRFIRDFLTPLGMNMDKFGNYYKSIGQNPVVLWSSHTDTVHNRKGFLKIGFDKNEVGVAVRDNSNCLGADDTAGVWLMIQMIKANRPGLYIFHRAEEGGRKGSKCIAEREKATPELFTGIKFAIALDRKGTDNIITHQMSLRCCSEEFSKSLAEQLGMGYKSDDGGSYTDTASYTDLLAECTNLSVGYRNAHSPMERLDVDFVFRLRDKLFALDASQLVEKRKPGEIEHKSYTYTGKYSGQNWSYRDDYGTDEWLDPPYKCTVSSGTASHPANNRTAFFGWIKDAVTGLWTKDAGEGWEYVRQHNGQTTLRIKPTAKMLGHRPTGWPKEDDRAPAVTETEEKKALSKDDVDCMVMLIQKNPEAIAELLETYEFDPVELEVEIMNLAGFVNV